MNRSWSIFLITGFFAVIPVTRQESWDDVVESFHWTPRTNATNVEWEFFIIGKRVTWSVAKSLCSSEGFNGKLNGDSLYPEDVFDYENSTSAKSKSSITPNSRLAVIDDDNARIWLARMLSESNYRYDGLWVGGHRANYSSNWAWIGDDRYKETVIPSTFLGTYPDWYRFKDHQDIEKNCLVFDRVGHDLPILVPTDCQLSKPYLCSRVVMKKTPKKIVEGIGVTVDGYRYTVFSVDDGHEDIANLENASGVRKLNGGGVEWRDARLECRKRGQHLAVVLNNEVAIALAGIMLKNRPSMESAWLGSWSTDGANWTWSPTGIELSSTKSSISEYPPWLSGHPVSSSSFENYYKSRGRCLLLDRHLCPDHISPVFLDLDCEKERPFICQDGAPQPSSLYNHRSTRSIQVEKRILVFSADQMTWNEGQKYCANNGGKIASILDSKTLSIVLEKMTDLFLHHIWVGGRTKKGNDGWKWFDENGKVLSRKGIGMGISWCLGDDEGSWLQAEPDTCLNLDREGHGLPLFYGLHCDLAKQHVLCGIDHASKSLHDASTEEKEIQEKSEKPGTVEDMGSQAKSEKPRTVKEKEVEAKLEKQDGPWGKFSVSGRRTFGTVPKIPTQPDVSAKSSNKDLKDDINEGLGNENIGNSQNGYLLDRKVIFDKLKVRNVTSDAENTTKNKEGVLKEDHVHREIETNSTKQINHTTNGTRIADLDEDTKNLLIASGYNLTDRDLILHWEMDLVDLGENTTVAGVEEHT